jgi:hypothetical protein
MKLSVKSCNLIAVSVAVETDSGVTITVPVFYDPLNQEVIFVDDNAAWNHEEFSAAIRDYMKSAASETSIPVNEETWSQIRTLKALAKPPSKK